jgi:hypothetical protein
LSEEHDYDGYGFEVIVETDIHQISGDSSPIYTSQLGFLALTIPRIHGSTCLSIMPIPRT